MNCGYEPELYDLVIPPSWFGDVEWYTRMSSSSGQQRAGSSEFSRALASIDTAP